MPPLRLHAGLGAHAEVEWLRIVWPDGVLQAELELAADRVAKIDELQGKVSSCPPCSPGTATRFDSSPISAARADWGILSPGIYARPTRPSTFPSRIWSRWAASTCSRSEPLEEVVYLDEARLIAVDHPAGTEVSRTR